MSKPGTLAGRALLADRAYNKGWTEKDWVPRILAIEAEARQQERERIRAAVEDGLDLTSKAKRIGLDILGELEVPV